MSEFVPRDDGLVAEDRELTDRQRRILQQFCTETKVFTSWRLFSGNSDVDVFTGKAIDIRFRRRDGKWVVRNSQTLGILASKCSFSDAIVEALILASLFNNMGARRELSLLLKSFINQP